MSASEKIEPRHIGTLRQKIVDVRAREQEAEKRELRGKLAQALVRKLFPAPLNEKYFLWALHYEDVSDAEDGSLWNHPGVTKEDDPENTDDEGCYTTAKAVDAGIEFLATYLSVPDSHLTFIVDSVSRMAAMYAHWIANPEAEGESVQSETILRAWVSMTGGIPAILAEIYAQEELPL